MSCPFIRGLAAPFALTLCAAWLGGCATTPTATAPETPQPEPASAPTLDFTPAHFLAPIEYQQARYRLLYAPESHAIWLTEEVNGLKLDYDRSQGIEIEADISATADLAAEWFIVIECRLESEFADASVAYDVVGLRNVEAYLETPDGTRVYPVQRIMAPHADEAQSDALTRFGRSTILVFPKTDMMSGAVSPVSGAPYVRLVLQGFHSTFYFRWNDTGSGSTAEDTRTRPADWGTAALDAVRTGYSSVYSLLSPLRRIVE